MSLLRRSVLLPPRLISQSVAQTPGNAQCCLLSAVRRRSRRDGRDAAIAGPLRVTAGRLPVDVLRDPRSRPSPLRYPEEGGVERASIRRGSTKNTARQGAEVL
ncbi:hypothetical protein AAFF_G00432460 [Aldrovandia affinis]|uniref:Uncharacterized protein n=1 Tax=Aldrovandia affinis TaxID=143900 RepID=A0AAD7S8H2_9TELE|nr:hypothetical protein AAFF_G00432460 [Aldrovandia affinis]